MVRRSRGRVVAGLLSALLPGAGQLYAGARRRGVVLLAVSVVSKPRSSVVAPITTRPSARVTT